MGCQKCGNYLKTKSEIMKHYQMDHIIFFITNHRYFDFKPLLEKVKPTLKDSFSDKPIAPIRTVGSQSFLSVSVNFGNGATFRTHKEIQCLTQLGIFKNTYPDPS